MEVTKSNFEEIFIKIEKAIRNCTFIALDTEFTGLYLGPEDKLRLFDTFEQRYQKLKSRATNFVPCQIGLTLFTKSLHENCYTSETYVFFVRPYMCGSRDRNFMMQASALDFLCHYEFDFNKFINEGIPYLNEREEEIVCEELENGDISFHHVKLMDLDVKRNQDVMINNTLVESFQNSKTSNISNKMKLELPLDKMVHPYFQVYELREKYPTLWIYASEDSIFVEKVSLDERKTLKENAKHEVKEVLNYYLGFSKVFRVMKETQKPIVGHNLLMDLMLCFHNFHKPLPDSYKEFKMELHSVFPTIFDTKHMWIHVKKVHKFKEKPKRSGLFELYNYLKFPSDELMTLFSPEIRYLNNEKYASGSFRHESGYDSFITGWVFLKICHLLAMKKLSNPLQSKPQSFKQYLNVVSVFLNKVNIARSREGYIDLAGADPSPQISELLYLVSRKCNVTLNPNELSRVFDRYPMVEFQMKNNQRGALLAVGNIGSYKDILRDFKDDPNYIVTNYSIFKHSSIFRTFLWSMALGSGCIIAIFLSKSLPK